MVNLTQAQKSHFLRKTCFAASPTYLNAVQDINDKGLLIDKLLSITSYDYDYPDWYITPVDTSELTKEERKQLRKQQSKSLALWWQKLMLHSSSPFEEVMTLFWHNHFVSSIQKVKSPYLMLKQNDLFRNQGLGSFVDLVDSVLKDPAMLLYLDNNNNKKQAPNENLARELLELFTLGEGNYTEIDVKEIARALTGASVKKRTGEYVFRQNWHDSGEKTIFGKTDNFTVDDLAALIVSQEACAPFIVSKLWRYFIDEEPVEQEIVRLSSILKEADYDLKVLVKAIFLTDAFWQSNGKTIKSPVHLIVGTYRQFELTELTLNRWVFFTKNMGQLLFSPPNVKGWPGGKAWYSSAAIFYRELFINRFLKWHKSLVLESSEDMLLATPPVASLPDVNHEYYLSIAMADPAYQLK